MSNFIKLNYLLIDFDSIYIMNQNAQPHPPLPSQLVIPDANENITTPGVFHFGAPSSSFTDNSPRNFKSRKNRITPPSTNCNICMETICGNVTLKCGHEMCPECYAKHSRVNNTCPYCREVFAPEVKKERHPRTRIQDIQGAETILDEFVREYYLDEVKDEIDNTLKDSGLSEDVTNDIGYSTYCHLYQIAMNSYNIMDGLLEQELEDV